jgi:hypothetical protein
VNQITILYPLFALVLLTFVIAIRMGRLRFAAVKRGDLSAGYYRLNRGGEVPAYLAKVSQNYDNLLELPILFYVVAVLLYVTNRVEVAQLILAWLFVVSRYVHSYIHTTSNNVMHRMRAFLTGVLALIGMWCLFFFRVVLA